MSKKERGEERYQQALNQVKDGLQHDETVSLLIRVLEKRSDFSRLVLDSLLREAKFWLILIGTSLLIAFCMLKFPELTKFLSSLLVSHLT
jgi:hypothetical protein